MNTEKFSSKELELATVDSLIALIYKLFFLLEPEVINKALNFIAKTITSIQDNEEEIAKKIKATWYRYLVNILPIKVFIGQNISDDKLIKQIKEQKIKDKNILNVIFEDLSLEMILKIFDDDLNNLIEFFNKVDYLTVASKQGIIIELFNEIINEDRYAPMLLKLIIKGNQASFLTEELLICLYNKILIHGLKSSIIYLDSDMIKFLLTSEYIEGEVNDPQEKNTYLTSKQNFILECRYLLRNKDYLKTKENFDIEGIKQLLNQYANQTNPETDLIINQTDTPQEKEQKASLRLTLGLDIEFNLAIELLKDYFENKVELSKYSMQAIIRSIGSKILECLELKNNGIYYHTSNQTDGFFEENESAISISTVTIDKFLDLNNKRTLYDRLIPLITIFHEITHYLLEENRKNNRWTPKTYISQKQWILRKYDFDLYMANWDKFKEEIEAELNGIDYLSKFIETYLPQLLDQIQDEIIEDLEQKKKMESNPYNEVMTFFANMEEEIYLVFDKLIEYNPTLLQKHPILNLEYYPNGTPKTYEDIWLERTEENNDLIEDILMKRYPSPLDLSLNSIHIK